MCSLTSRSDAILLRTGLVKKSVESDIVEELEELGVQVLHWYDLLGWDSEPGVPTLTASTLR